MSIRITKGRAAKIVDGLLPKASSGKTKANVERHKVVSDNPSTVAARTGMRRVVFCEPKVHESTRAHVLANNLAQLVEQLPLKQSVSGSTPEIDHECKVVLAM